MKEYGKIQTAFRRNMESKHKEILPGQWSLPEFEILAGLPWEWTEKVDGTNIRVIRNAETIAGGRSVEFRGKTNAAQIPGPLDRALHAMFNRNDGLTNLGDDVVLYGEGYGAGIQRGGCYRPDPTFILFDAIIGGYWLRRSDVYDVAAKLGIAAVPVVGVGTLSAAIDAVANGLPSRLADCQAEGLVMRPPVDLWNRRGERIITKIKAVDFVKR